MVSPAGASNSGQAKVNFAKEHVMSMFLPARRSLWIVALALLACTSWNLHAQDSAADIASQVDRLLSEEMGVQPGTHRASDEVFLRRSFLDIVGEPPSSEDVLAFVLDERPDKRARLIQQLLADQAYGKNWGRFWRDVIMFRRSEDRAVLAQRSLEGFLVEQFNANRPWNEIATELITAKGNVQEDGRTGLIMAQGGRPEDTVAEISRIFVGIQIQCAQCHDHPTDRWTREQFHQLAAFFPRVAVRPTMGDTRSFNVVADDVPSRRRTNNNNRFRGTPEHYMPDLEDPQAEGTLMQPVFFVTGQQLETGVLDEDRRKQLSRWLTSPENPWFARAIVNRLWSELVGEGFYEPVDDIGPDRECSAPRTLDLLSSQFVEHQYDLKWLMETIQLTATYQLDSSNRRTIDELPFQANCPQRLRSDQLFNSLLSVFEIQDLPTGRSNGYGAAVRQNRSAPRLLFNSIFGFDPSTRRDEITGSIPQALAMMNSPFINQQVDAQRGRVLPRMLSEVTSDRQLVEELYLKVLSRQPTRQELKVCLDYRKGITDRGEAFEDILWALLNHSEFIHRK